MSSLLNSARLNIQALDNLSEQISSRKNDILERLYQLFKAGYTLSKSSHFKGGAADAFKSYMENGPIQVITELMDVYNATEMIIKMILATFREFESCDTGVVVADRLVEIEYRLGEHKDKYESYVGSLQNVLCEAAAYISVESPDFTRIPEDYTSSKNTLNEIKLQLEEADEEACIFADDLYTQIERTMNLLERVKSACYEGSVANYKNMESLINFDWYRKGDNLTLQSLMQTKPFTYLRGDVSVSENQWLVGLTDDMYAYAGYGFLNADGTLKIDEGTFFASGAASILEVNGYAQLTKDLRSEADAQVGYAEGSVEIGKNGYHIKGDAAFIKAHVELVLGDENANLTVFGNGEALAASADVVCEFDMESGAGRIGAQADATAGKVKGGIAGTNGAFGVSISASAGGSVGGGFHVESRVVTESEYINLNSVELDIGAALGLGLDIKVDVPYLYPKVGKLFGF